MVRLPREHHPAPSELTEKQTEWTARWRGIHESGTYGDWATRAARQLLRDALVRLTHGKCAYCENSLDSIEIDHYIAKSVDVEKAFEWLNLFPVCGACNSAKGNSDHCGLLLKPDDEDPEPCFRVGPFGQLEPHPSSDAALVERVVTTIRLCKTDARCAESAALQNLAISDIPVAAHDTGGHQPDSRPDIPLQASRAAHL